MTQNTLTYTLTRQVLPTLLALLMGIVIGGRFAGGDDDGFTGFSSANSFDDRSARAPWEPASRSDIEPSDDSLSALSQRLSEERRARQQLAQQIASLQEQVEALEEQLTSATPTLDADALAEAALSQTLAELESSVATGSPDDRQLRRFIDAGFPPDRAADLKARQDELSLKRLFLRDQARREGWMGSERYRTELAQINEGVEQLRSELGDSDYDRFLYATGRPNRVLVRTTLTGGPAQEAGLQPGDAILSYDGARVFDTRSLVTMTQGGSFGTPTSIEVERDGERLVLYIPRGPLGLNMRSTTQRPEEGG
ncbi:MAG: PDZ domain-containing protein [Pseudomonadota bacterium]